MMRYSIFLLLGMLILSSATCKKDKMSPAVDGIQIVRTGGFAGMNDRYEIRNGHVSQDTSRQYNDNYNFNYLLPQSKYDQVKGLLSAIPSRMMEEGGYTYGQQYMDGFTYNITAYQGSKATHWIILNDEPDYVKPFMQKLNEAIENLRSK